MELKLQTDLYLAARHKSSNRTFMELKWEHQGGHHEGTTSSNRTFMELKWNGAKGARVTLHSSNRTFMELK